MKAPTARQWRMWTWLSAATVAISVVLLLSTGIPVFTWTAALGLLALVGCGIGAWLGRPANSEATRRPPAP